MTTTALIDGDLFAYQFAAAEERAVEFDGTFVLTADATTGRHNLESAIRGWADTLDADRIVVALSDDLNFRKEVMPEYKSNRDGIRRPMILKALKEHLEATFECFTRPTLEADDVLGILATNPKVIPGDKIIVTEDKDLRSVPGLHWNPRKEGEKEDGPTRIGVAQADQNFYAQVLSGDATDGYSGCPGIGVVRALDIVRNPFRLVYTETEIKRGPNKGTMRGQWLTEPVADVWDAIVSHYEKAGLTEEDAIRTARVARILRTEDYDYKRKEPILWNPRNR